MEFITEGVNDKNIFKAIFTFGAPGAGKTFIGKKIAGMAGFKRVDVDRFGEMLARKQNVDLHVIDYDTPGVGRDIYHKSRQLTGNTLELYIDGRLPVIVDGTGRSYGAIVRNAKRLHALGYDTMALFVNTDLKTSKARAAARPERGASVDYIEATYFQIQQNLGAFQAFFKDDMLIIDNSENSTPDWNYIVKRILAFCNKPVTSPTAQEWIKGQHNARSRSAS